VLKISISPLARLNLEEIWLYTFKTSSLNQANKYQDELFNCFELISGNNSIGKSLDSIKSGYRMVHVNHNYVFYTCIGPDVQIMSILPEHVSRQMKQLILLASIITIILQACKPDMVAPPDDQYRYLIGAKWEIEDPSCDSFGRIDCDIVPGSQNLRVFGVIHKDDPAVQSLRSITTMGDTIDIAPWIPGQTWVFILYLRPAPMPIDVRSPDSTQIWIRSITPQKPHYLTLAQHFIGDEEMYIEMYDTDNSPLPLFEFQNYGTMAAYMYIK
jgi:toxin ParE1/3/4